MKCSGDKKELMTSLVIVETTLDLRCGGGGGEGSLVHVWPIRGCRTREGMFKSLRALTSLVKAR